MAEVNKRELFEDMPIAKSLATMAIPTIISQLINLIYNMVDAFFIGRTGNSYMMAATTLTLTLTMMSVAFSNLFGVGGGSLIARLLGAGREEDTKTVSAYAGWGAVGLALLYALSMGLFLNPILRFLGASDATIGYARQYTILVIVIGAIPTILSLTLAHILRNTGNATQASMGLSGGGVLNMILDPLFMFVILPRGYEVIGAALATLISNILACAYLLHAFHKTSLSLRPRDAMKISEANRKSLFVVGVPSAILTGLFDVANICVNMLSAAHSDLVLAGMGIVMKVERVPNAVNVGLCQGMLPIVAYNYAAGNKERMQKTIDTARLWGLSVSFVSIILFEIFARPLTHVFLSTKSQEAAITTLAYAALFLRIRCIASPMQFINYSSSFSMQAIGDGKSTMLHAVVRELVFYIPFMFILDRLFGEVGLASALVAGEGCGAIFAMYLLKKSVAKARG